jgi:hypothetical protein
VWHTTERRELRDPAPPARREQHCEDASKDPTAARAATIACIEEMIEALAGRFHQFDGDPGHWTRITIVQGILKALIKIARNRNRRSCWLSPERK